MNRRRGWFMVCVGAALFLIAWLGISLVAFAWASAVLEGVVD